MFQFDSKFFFFITTAHIYVIWIFPCTSDVMVKKSVAFSAMTHDSQPCRRRLIQLANRQKPTRKRRKIRRSKKKKKRWACFISFTERSYLRDAKCIAYVCTQHTEYKIIINDMNSSCEDIQIHFKWDIGADGVSVPMPHTDNTNSFAWPKCWYGNITKETGFHDWNNK